MGSKQIAAVTTLVALGLFAGACASKDGTGPTISLSQQEVWALAGELGDVMNNISLVSARASGGPLLSLRPGPLFSAASSVNQTLNCPISGTTSASGSYTSTATTQAADITFGYNACKTTHYVAGGSVRAVANVSSNSTTLTLQSSFVGTLTVTATDGRSGSCRINFTLNGTATQTATTYAAQGTACGVTVTGNY